jgi:TonB family protein
MRLCVVIAALLACAHPAGSAAQGTPEQKRWLEDVRSAVGAVWVERVQDAARLNDPNGCKYSSVDRRVVVEFVVAADGRLSSVRIRKSSEAPYIDRAALDAFRAASPFAPPPTPLADERLPFGLTLQAKPGIRFLCR